MTDVAGEDRRLHASVDTGFIGQNVFGMCIARWRNLAQCFATQPITPGLEYRAAAIELDGTEGHAMTGCQQRPNSRGHWVGSAAAVTTCVLPAPPVPARRRHGGDFDGRDFGHFRPDELRA